MKSTESTWKLARGNLYALVVMILLTAGIGQADEWSDARQVMQQATDELLRRLNVQYGEHSDDPQHLYGVIEEVILPIMDMETFSRLVLYKHWQPLSDSQRRNFVESFQSMLIRTYGKRLLLTEVENLVIEYDPEPKGDPGKKYQIVGSRVLLGSSEDPLDVSYSLIDQDGWKVFDIIINGTSLARQLRGAYDTEIQESGFDALLERLEKAGAQ